MRRFPICTTAAATLALGGSFATAQMPLFTNGPTRITGVRAGDQYYAAQQPGVPAPMPKGPSVVVPPVGSNPMGTNPMGTNPMGTNPMGSATQGNPMGSTPLPAPREVPGGVPSATYPTGMVGGYPMQGENYQGYVGGEYQGGPNTCGGPFSYLNDAPPGNCAPGGEYGPIGGRPGLARFVQPGKWYGSAEYLLWWTKGTTPPPLLTTSNANDNGILGGASTQILLGNGPISNEMHSGGRFNLGYWFGCDQRWGFDATYLFLGKTTKEFAFTSGGDPLLARPFTNANTGQQFSEIIAYPGQASGGFVAKYETSFWSADANLRRFLWGNACNRLDLLMGYKYMNLSEELTLRETVNRLPGGFNGVNSLASSAIVTDVFRTENHFNGGQLGLIGEMRRGRWYLDSTLKVALGNMNQSSRINGSQIITNTNGVVTSVPGGLLALPGGNMGQYSQNKFAVVPEATVNLGYHITPNLRVFVGYNFLYASSVLRPGDQIDTNLDVTRIPNFPTSATQLATIHPSPTMRDTSFFAQGISFGLQFKW